MRLFSAYLFVCRSFLNSLERDIMIQYTSLRTLSEAKGDDGEKLFPGIKKAAAISVDPRLLVIDYDKLLRPIDQAHVDSFKESWRAKSSIPKIIAQVIDNKIVVHDGNHRTTAIQQLIAEGEEIDLVEIDEFKGSAIQAIGLGVTSSQGKPLTPLQSGNAYFRMVELGATQKEIAAITGKTIAHVSQMLKLTQVEPDIKAMIAAGEVSASTALATVKKRGKDASTALAAEISTAKQAGKKKITQKVLKAPPKDPCHLSDMELRKLSDDAIKFRDEYWHLSTTYPDRNFLQKLDACERHLLEFIDNAANMFD
jgi:hypothetical protein